MYADLHTHTTASDGTLPPAELVHAAREAGMDYLAICDHDTVAGIAPAELAAKAAGLRFIAGVELSAEGPPGKCHLLGLGIDPAHPELVETLAEISRNRHARNVRMAERLAALGAPLTLADVTALAPPGANIGRPHFAHALIVRGYVSDMNEAFSRYLSDSGPAYVSKATLTPQESIHLIHAAGGLCFIAHPGLLSRQNEAEGWITVLQRMGMDGLEAYYGKYAPHQTDFFVRLAARLDLLVTGGSDFHGANKPDVPLGLVRDGERLPATLLSPELLARAL